MAKRPHPKTIEDKLHQILYMDHDSQLDHEVDLNKKCYINLKSATAMPCATLATLNYPLKNPYSQVNKSCDGKIFRVGRRIAQRFGPRSTAVSLMWGCKSL